MAKLNNQSHRHAGPLPLNAPLWAQRFIGICYKDDGHSFEGSNCFGLVYLVLKERCGIIINPQADVSAADADRASMRAQLVASCEPWTQVVGKPRAFDVALLQGKPFHTGILITDEVLLHVWRAPRSMAMHLSNPHIRERIIGFYRHSVLT